MAKFRIDQGSVGPDGQSRHDLVPGQEIRCVVTDPVGSDYTYEWELIDHVGSPSAVGTVDGDDFVIGPGADLGYGTSFLIRLKVTGPDGVEEEARYASIRTQSARLRYPTFGERAPADHTISSNDPDASTDNATYEDLSGLGLSGKNWSGWREWAREVVSAVEQLSGSATPADPTRYFEEAGDTSWTFVYPAEAAADKLGSEGLAYGAADLGSYSSPSEAIASGANCVVSFEQADESSASRLSVVGAVDGVNLTAGTQVSNSGWLSDVASYSAPGGTANVGFTANPTEHELLLWDDVSMGSFYGASQLLARADTGVTCDQQVVGDSASASRSIGVGPGGIPTMAEEVTGIGSSGFGQIKYYKVVHKPSGPFNPRVYREVINHEYGSFIRTDKHMSGGAVPFVHMALHDRSNAPATEYATDIVLGNAGSFGFPALEATQRYENSSGYSEAGFFCAPTNAANDPLLDPEYAGGTVGFYIEASNMPGAGVSAFVGWADGQPASGLVVSGDHLVLQGDWTLDTPQGGHNAVVLEESTSEARLGPLLDFKSTEWLDVLDAPEGMVPDGWISWIRVGDVFSGSLAVRFAVNDTNPTGSVTFGSALPATPMWYGNGVNTIFSGVFADCEVTVYAQYDGTFTVSWARPEDTGTSVWIETNFPFTLSLRPAH